MIRQLSPAFLTIALGTGLLAAAPAWRAAAETAAEPGAAAPAPVMPALARLVADDPALDAFYAARAFAPVWGIAGGSAHDRARHFLRAVARAERHALPPERYDPRALQSRLYRDWTAEAEMAFTRAYLAYARDVSSGLLAPRRLSRNIDVDPVRPDRRALMEGIARSPDPARHLAGLAPQSEDYRWLMRHYEMLGRVAVTDPDAWGPEVPRGPTLRLGDHGPRVAILRERLAAMGDLDPDYSSAGTAGDVVLAANEVASDVEFDTGTPDERRYDRALEAAVKRFQERHGLNVDGMVGPATLGALNHSPAFRAKQVAVNLERARWLNGRLEGDRIVANLPDFRVEMIRGGEVVFESRVVIGRQRHQTVEFSDELDHMVVNPTWFVPNSIATQEILPKLQENPGYLASKNMRLVGADASLIEWSMVTPDTFPGRIRQAPGPGNALGRVKFMFPNDHAIYLHDTPQRSLFRRDNRAFSHGCVRVEKPIEFAHALLEGEVDNPEASFAHWLRRGSEAYFTFDRKTPVHLIYRTAWRDREGQVQYRSDVYRRDRIVAEALAAKGVEVPGLD